MKTSKKGIDLIKQFEGCRLQTYKCSAGVDTIGYGHTGKDVQPAMKITETQAEVLLSGDLTFFENGVNKLGLPLSQNQFDALVSFAFNLGLGNLQSSTLLKKARINPTDKSIRNEFNKWVNAGGKRIEGLVKRRAAEANLYFS